MKISNFRLIETKGKNELNRIFIAEVEVETGMLFWKKKTTRKVAREYGRFWFFLDNGESCPGFAVERLARAWKAQTGQEV